MARNVLVIYPGLAGRRPELLAPHRWRLRLAGVRLMLADEDIRPGDERTFSALLRLPPPEHVATAWRRLRAFLDSHRIHAIVCQSEDSLLLGSLAARHLGLPGPSPAAAYASTDKFFCRQRLARTGLPQPAFALIHDAREARAFAAQQGWPIVLKALASARQRLVTLVKSEEDLEGALARMHAALPHSKDVQRLRAFAALEGLDIGCDARRYFLAESFAAGVPMECDGVIQDGAPLSFGVCEQGHAQSPAFFIESYLLPSPRPQALLTELEEYTARALSALGLNHTGYSVEYRCGSDGTRLIEVNGRLGWDEGLDELYTVAGGQSPQVLALKLALGARLGKVQARRPAALVYRSQYEAGRVAQLPSPASLQRLRRKGLRCALHVAEHDLVLGHQDAASLPHLAHVIATHADSSEQARKLAQQCAADLQLVVLPTPAAQRAGTQPAARAAHAAHQPSRPTLQPGNTRGRQAGPARGPRCRGLTR